MNTNSCHGSVTHAGLELSNSGGKTYALSFALFEDHTIPNRSKLYIKRRNALNNTVEYVYFKINDVDQNMINSSNILFEEHVFRQTPGFGFSVLEEIQISPDGTRLCAANNNLGGPFFSFSGNIIQFLLNENHEPSYLGILANSSTFASYITHLDFSSGSNKVFFVQQPFTPSNPRLYFQDVYGNDQTTFLSETRSAVRRLNDGDLYFRLPTGTNGYLAKIVGANGPSPGLSNQLIIDLPPAFSSLMTLIPHFSTQPHRLYPHKGVYPRVVGEKLYELTDHLGNVRTTITDRKIATFDNWNITGFSADITSANDYFPFGSEMPGRSYNSGDYRFGFNGKEKDDEVKGNGNQYDYGFRIYDPRLGKFLSVDPLTSSYPWYTPYQFAGNKPIMADDLDGLEERIRIYSEHNGKTKLVTYDSNQMLIISEEEGSFAMNKTMSKEQWISMKKAMFQAYSGLKEQFPVGYNSYTAGMGGTDPNTTGFSGYGKGTLTIATGGDSHIITFDANDHGNLSGVDIGIYLKALKTFNPLFPVSDPLVAGSAEFAKTVKTVQGVAGAVATAPGAGVTSLVGLGATGSLINTVDDFTKDANGQTLIEKAVGEGVGTVLKTGLGVGGVGSAAKNIQAAQKNMDKVTNSVGFVIDGKNTIENLKDDN